MILASKSPTPAGMKLAGNQLHITAPMTLVGWDFEGLEVWIDADVTLVRPHFHNASGGAHFLHIGEVKQSKPTVTILRGDMDAGGLNGLVGESAVGVSPGANLITRGCYWHDAFRDYMTFAGDSWSAQGDVFRLFGAGMPPGSHTECVHIYSGSIDLSGVMFDVGLYGDPLPKAGFTSPLFLQSKLSAIITRLRNCTFIGGRDLGLLYGIQADARIFPLHLDLVGNILEPGIHGAFVGPTPGAGGAPLITGSGNINALTGAPINLTWPKA
jgi:hypothetical protein